jgi:hypothetical protein
MRLIYSILYIFIRFKHLSFSLFLSLSLSLSLCQQLSQKLYCLSLSLQRKTSHPNILKDKLFEKSMFNLLEQKFYQFYNSRIITIVLARDKH